VTSTAPAVEVVVVGSGIAGLTAALHALADGCRVTVVTKGELTESNTRYAQGGIAAVMSADDSVADHLRDTLVAGAGLADAAAAEVLVSEGPRRLAELIERGVAFDRTDDGTLVRGLEAAHSAPRILHAGGDATGAAIEQALVTALRRACAGGHLQILEHAFLVDLVCDDGAVCGVDVLAGGERRTFPAHAVVLATGGAGQLYAHTTNPAVATADGIAAALRADVPVSDLEFVQFHPTVLPASSGYAAFLVSEAVRGEGAVLRDARGSRFMLEVHPDAELAPRDVVARAIAETMPAQGGRPVVLDATALRGSAAETAAFLAQRFPTIDAAMRARGLDWACEPVPVTPAAHYLMGGIDTDLHGRTGLRGLYAVGETARTGVHGANRLASNSLLEGVVFGARAGDVLRADAVSALWPVPGAATSPTRVPHVAASFIPAPLIPAAPVSVPAAAFDRASLQDLLWRDAGLVRDADGLRRAASVLASWTAQQGEPRTVAEFEDRNLLLVAQHLVAAALARWSSVGAHFRSDAPPVPASAPRGADHDGRQAARRNAARRAPEPARKVPA